MSVAGVLLVASAGETRPLASLVTIESRPLQLLFLGDNGHHQPSLRHRQLVAALESRGLIATYATDIGILRSDRLAKFDGVIVYANIGHLPAAEERALLDFVADGKGFIPIHCASYCFHNSKAYVDLVGAQFKSHATGVFRTELANVDHPILQGYSSFASWDETYVHHRHNSKDRTVLEFRTSNGANEPWTWIRRHGKGRVFYTAWGHDERTWSHPGFHNLLERGIRFACGQSLVGVPAYVDRPEMTPRRQDLAAVEFLPAKVPYYPAGQRWGVTTEPIPKMPKPLSVAESIKRFVVPKGFRIATFVAEDKLAGKPLSMTWDESGTLYVALTQDYPNELQRPGKGRDRIVVCRDLDGDGDCDRVDAYADSLSIPTSLLWFAGGMIVHQPQRTVYLKDTDGDGRADLRQTLLDGWGFDDTHAGPSNLQFGPDDWIYGMVGYSGFRGMVAGERHDFRQGFYRLRLERQAGDHRLAVRKLEFVRSTSNNSWGVGFNERGELFGSTANGCPSVFVPIANRYYERVRGLAPPPLESIALDNHFEPITDQVRQVDHHGGFTAAAGHSIYTARSYPPEYWDRTAFICEPTGHLIATMVLQPAGAGYVARYGWNLVASEDEWSSPIAAEVGPDGNVWFIDWYNYIVQHNPTPAGFSTGKGNAYETPLRDKSHGRIYRVVWPQGKATTTPKLAGATASELRNALAHPNGFWRRHAQRLLFEGGVESPKVETRQAMMDGLSSPIASRRLRSLLAVADVERIDDEMGRALAESWLAQRSSDDRILRDAAVIAASRCSTSYLEVVLAANPTPLPQADLHALRIVAGNVLERSNPNCLNLLAPHLARANAPLRSSVVAGLANVAKWPTSIAGPSDASEKAIAALLESASTESSVEIFRLVERWGAKDISKHVANAVERAIRAFRDSARPEVERIAAVRQLVALKAPVANLKEVVGSIDESTSETLARGVFEALAAATSSSALADQLIAKLGSLNAAIRADALRLVLLRAESTAKFLAAVESGSARFDALPLDQQMALSAHPDKAIAARARRLLEQGGGLPDPDRQKAIDAVLPALDRPADPTLGKALFAKHCAKCHRHGSEGGSVGPELTGMAVHPKRELLIHLLDPNRSVEGNFRSYTIAAADGQILTGLRGSETRTTVELIDAEAKRHTLRRDEIETMVESKKSLMPEGFERQMSIIEIGHLLEFLTQKGRFVPIPLDRFATAISTRGMFYDEAADAERLVFAEWSPKKVDETPFALVDPRGTTVKNVVMLKSPLGVVPPRMPDRVRLPCNMAAIAVHMLSGVGGWCYPATPKGTVSAVVVLHYADGEREEHPLINGVHFADYIRRVDVPGSRLAFRLRGQQVRYLVVRPKRRAVIAEIELRKGPDPTAPVFMAVTVER